VIQHVQTAVLENVQFKVNPGGRARVLLEKQKNVHAFVVAEQVKLDDHEGVLEQIKYNPYKGPSFMLGEEPIFSARKVLLKEGRCWLLQR
jgi:hypothetical protein